MRFFIDNCLPHRVASALQALDSTSEIQHLRDRFKADTPDLEWIQALIREGDWVIVTRDQMYKVRQEKEAIRKAGQVFFFLSKAWGNLPLWEQASKLFHWWPRILEQARSARRNECFLVPPKGNTLTKFTLE